MTLQELKDIYKNLNLGPLQDVVWDVDLEYVSKQLKTIKSNELKVKYLAGLAGYNYDFIEATLSNFTRMKKLREELFTEWLEKGRPDSHIAR